VAAVSGQKLLGLASIIKLALKADSPYAGRANSQLKWVMSVGEGGRDEVAKSQSVSSLAEIKIQIGRDAAALIMNRRICHLMNLWTARAGEDANLHPLASERARAPSESNLNILRTALWAEFVNFRLSLRLIY
jgi:hypothetical protein